MNDSSRGGAAAVVGLGLVAIGVWLLLGRVLGPFFWPLRAALHLLGRVGWPLAIIMLGGLIITRGRRREERMNNNTYVSTGSLTRSRSNRVIAGVLAGFAAHFGWSPSTLRLGYALFTVLTGVWPGVFAYVFAAIFMPEEPFGYSNGYGTATYAPAPPAPAPTYSTTAPVPPVAPGVPAPPAPPEA